MHAASCTIIVPNYNGYGLLQKTLPEVLNACESYDGLCEVLVVDDASTDQSMDYLTSLEPRLRILRHTVNLGFAKAVHSGVANSTGDLIMLVNSDVLLTKECIGQLASCLEEPKIFAVSPMIYDQNHTLIPSTLIIPQLRRGHIQSLPLNVDQRKDNANPPLLHSLYCSGGSIMVRRSMFNELGGFSDIFRPFYSEDFDLGLRAWYRGWLSVVHTQSHITHFDKGAISAHFSEQDIKFTQRRNRLLLEWIHLPLAYLLLVNLPMVLFQLIGEIALLDGKNVRAFFAAVKLIPDAVQLRRLRKRHQEHDFMQVMARVRRRYGARSE